MKAYIGNVIRGKKPQCSCNQKGSLTKQMHEILKNMFIADTSKELNTNEFKDYCEQIRVWSMTEFNFVLEEPETNK